MKLNEITVSQTKEPKELNKEESINVSIRVRPFLRSELGNGDILYFDPTVDTKIKIGRNSNYYEGNYHKVFGINSTQNEVFDFVKEAIPDVLGGINNTIFAYGQTGSGKTFTMFGSDWTQFEKIENFRYKKDKNGNIVNDFYLNPFSEDNGIIPKSISSLFTELEKLNKEEKRFTILCSFLQVYNEKIYDLLEVNKTYKLIIKFRSIMEI